MPDWAVELRVNIAQLKDDIHALKQDVSTIRRDLNDLSNRVSHLDGGDKTFKWVISVVIGSIVGTAILLGNSHIERIAQRVFREELTFRKTLVQTGRFTSKNKVSTNPPAFAWNLAVPINDQSELVSVTAEPLEPLPDIQFSAELSEDRTKCIMTLQGSEKVLAALPDVIAAKVTIAIRE